MFEVTPGVANAQQEGRAEYLAIKQFLVPKT